MPTSATNTFTGRSLEPFYDAEDALMINVNLPASVTLAAGTVLGEITGTPGTFKAYSAANVAAPVAAATLSDSATAGTYQIGSYWVVYTYTNGVGETTISPIATVAIGTNNHSIGVASLTPLPTGATGVKFYAATAADGPFYNVTPVGATGAATTIAAPPVVTSAQPPATNTAASANDGSQVAKALLKYACVTDASGNITYQGSGTAGGALTFLTHISTPAYIAGTFSCLDLTGLDANALTNLNARLINGTISTGVVRLG